MKKIFVAASLFFAMQAQAQESTLLNKEFWTGNPTIEAVKSEFSKKAFNFKEVMAGDDPLSLAINNDAPIDVIKFLAGQPGVDFKRGIHEGRTYLHAAASKGNGEAVDCLIKSGSDINFTDAHDQTALSYSAYVGKTTLPVLEAFVKNGFDVNTKFEKKGGANILLLAAPADHDLAITDYLVSKGVSLHSVDNNGATIVDYAAKLGNVDILRKLIQKGAKYTDNSLTIAAQGPFRSANTIGIYKFLVEDLKLDPKATNKQGQNVLHLIAGKQDQSDIIAYFLEKGVDVNQKDRNGNTAFMGIAGIKSAEIVEGVLPNVKDINAVNNKGESALTNAVKSSTAEVVSLLVKSGANVKLEDNDGHNLAYIAVDAYRGAGGRGGFGGRNAGGQSAAPKISPAVDLGNKLDLLKEKGLNVAASASDGSTLYHLAVTKNDPDLLKKVSTLGIDVNAKNAEGMTALHKAAMLAKKDDVLQVLVAAGAKKELQTSFGETAYDLASENELLKQANISVDFLK